MGVFEYLGVMLSVILGLGVTHILAGASKTIQHRRTLRVFWVQALWGFNILVYIVIIWWGMFWWSGEHEWSFFQFLLLIFYAVLLFLAASLIYPWELPAEFDFEEYFYTNRPWFFAVLSACWVVDIPETVMKAEQGLRGLPDSYVGFIAVQLCLSLLGAMWSSRVFHRFYAAGWPVITLGYLSLTTLAELVG